MTVLFPNNCRNRLSSSEVDENVVVVVSVFWVQVALLLGNVVVLVVVVVVALVSFVSFVVEEVVVNVVPVDDVAVNVVLVDDVTVNVVVVPVDDVTVNVVLVDDVTVNVVLVPVEDVAVNVVPVDDVVDVMSGENFALNSFKESVAKPDNSLIRVGTRPSRSSKAIA